ncbi:hypothetical protein CEH78_003077 [Salmonella enterica]|nr:hypothetical protein [Salmonella enterica]
MKKQSKRVPANFFLPEYTLERAAEAMNVYVKPFTVTPDDFMLWWKAGTIDLCYLWGQDWSESGFVVPDYAEFIAATDDGISYYNDFEYVDDGSGGEYFISPRMLVRPYMSGISDDNWIEAHPGYSERKGMAEIKPRFIKFQHSKDKLRVPPPEMAKVYRMIVLFHEKHEPEGVTIPNGYEERFARDQLQFLQIAVRILSEHPDKCRGTKKDISPEKWRDAVLQHRNEFPRMSINSPETFLKHLRKAVNFEKKCDLDKEGE